MQAKLEGVKFDKTNQPQPPSRSGDTYNFVTLPVLILTGKSIPDSCLLPSYHSPTSSELALHLFSPYNQDHGRIS